MSDEEKKTAKKAAPKAKAAEAGAAEAKKAAAKKPAAKKADAAEKADAKPAKAAKKADAVREKKTDTGIKKQGKIIDHIRLYDVIERPIITEKSNAAAEQNKVVFAINPTATKKDVKDAVEALFQVKVTKVNTVLTKGKAKKFRGRNGQRSDQRKAIVTLAKGQMIDLTAGLK